ncbi:ankyrin repeat-containing domain protein [Hysterangium stoloniferum]|nr:ankyrin repeat-containing domain protein [Hysterangium stoloniferum]
MTIHIPDQFEAAAVFLSDSTSPALAKVSDNVKLELYALYKCIKVSQTPLDPRPSLFDFTGRAKWDAWHKLGSENDHTDVEVWQQRYVDIARSLGWEPNPHPAVAANEHQDEESSNGGGGGMGVSVSVISRLPLDEPEDDESTLHACALSNDATQLTSFLASHPDIDVNALDDYGYTALHLAADRGNTSVVKALLERGADTSVEDPDELTALHLAETCGHHDIVAMIREYLSP